MSKTVTMNEEHHNTIFCSKLITAKEHLKNILPYISPHNMTAMTPEEMRLKISKICMRCLHVKCEMTSALHENIIPLACICCISGI